MPYYDLPFASFYIAAVVIAVIAYPIASIARARRKAQARIRESFGRIPPRDRDTANVNAYHDAAREACRESEIDAVTWNDLDMGRVFNRINACQTSIGEEYLFALLHWPQFEPEALDKRERLIQWLDANPEACFGIQYALACLGKERSSGLAALAWNARSRIFKRAALLRVLAAMPLASMLIMFVNVPLGAAAIACFALCNFFVYHYHKLRMDADFTTLRYLFAAFSCCKALLGKTYPGWEGHAAELAAAFRPFRTTAGWLGGSYLTRQAFSELQFFTDIVKQIFLVDVVRYNKVMDKIARHQAEFRRLYEALGEIDAAASVLSFRKSLPWHCAPVFGEKSSIAFTGMYHPLLENPVPCDGKISRGSIVTGSNASGKSTFIKALAVNGILAQTINTCCAYEFAARPALVMTSMAVRDSITDGESYFITELKSLKRILDKIRDHYCVCYIDEILRGTNTPERIAASYAVLKHVAAMDCLFVVASHDVVLAELLEELYDNYSFSERVTENGVEFDYRLRDGPSRTRNAILLLKHMGFDPAIIREAMEQITR